MPQPETAEIELEATTQGAIAQAMIVSNETQFAQAGAFLRVLKGCLKQVDEAFDEHISRAHETHKALVKAKKEQAEPFLRAEALVKGKVAGYLAAEEAKRREEQRRLEAEARKAEAERRALELAEMRRKAAEAAKAAATKAEAERIRREALAEAAAWKAAPLVVAPVVMAEAPKAEGVSTKETWDFEIVDKRKIPLEYLEPNTVAIGKVVRALGLECSIPGIRTFVKRTVAVRS